MMRLAPDLVLIDGRFERGRAIAIADGRIADVGAAPAAGGEAADVERLPGKALLPGTVNAHCHTFQSLLRGLGDDLDFMAWRDRVLYPYSTRLDREGIYLGAAFAFAEMLLHGATTCVDFFYLQDEGNANAEAVIQAARDTGIRLVLARAMYDWDGAPARYREAPRDAARRVRDLIEHARGRPHDLRPARAAQPARRLARDDPGRIRGRGGGRHALSHPRGRGPVRGPAHAGGARRDPIRYLDRARGPRSADDRRALRLAR